MERDKSITIYTIIFLFILSGFIGFIIYKGSKDSTRNAKIEGRVNPTLVK
jgi:hypothetical protein